MTSLRYTRNVERQMRDESESPPPPPASPTNESLGSSGDDTFKWVENKHKSNGLAFDVGNIMTGLGAGPDSDDDGDEPSLDDSVQEASKGESFSASAAHHTIFSASVTSQPKRVPAKAKIFSKKEIYNPDEFVNDSNYGSVMRQLSIDEAEKQMIMGSFGRNSIRTLFYLMLSQDWIAVQELLESDPYLACEWSKDGKLGLHQACACGAPPSILMLLLELHGDAIEILSNNARRMLPLHYYVANQSGGSGGRGAICNDGLELLLQPPYGKRETLKIRDGQAGRLALHHAAIGGHGGMILGVLQLYPKAVIVRDSKGRSPMQYYQQNELIHPRVFSSMKKVYNQMAKLQRAKLEERATAAESRPPIGKKGSHKLRKPVSAFDFPESYTVQDIYNAMLSDNREEQEEERERTKQLVKMRVVAHEDTPVYDDPENEKDGPLPPSPKGVMDFPGISPTRKTADSAAMSSYSAFNMVNASTPKASGNSRKTPPSSPCSESVNANSPYGGSVRRSRAIPPPPPAEQPSMITTRKSTTAKTVLTTPPRSIRKVAKSELPPPSPRSRKPASPSSPKKVPRSPPSPKKATRNPSSAKKTPRSPSKRMVDKVPSSPTKVESGVTSAPLPPLPPKTPSTPLTTASSKLALVDSDSGSVLSLEEAAKMAAALSPRRFQKQVSPAVSSPLTFGDNGDGNSVMSGSVMSLEEAAKLAAAMSPHRFKAKRESAITKVDVFDGRGDSPVFVGTGKVNLTHKPSSRTPSVGELPAVPLSSAPAESLTVEQQRKIFYSKN